MAILSLQCFTEFSSVAVVTELATVWSRRCVLSRLPPQTYSTTSVGISLLIREDLNLKQLKHKPYLLHFLHYFNFQMFYYPNRRQ